MGKVLTRTVMGAATVAANPGMLIPVNENSLDITPTLDDNVNRMSRFTFPSSSEA